MNCSHTAITIVSRFNKHMISYLRIAVQYQAQNDTASLEAAICVEVQVQNACFAHHTASLKAAVCMYTYKMHVVARLHTVEQSKYLWDTCIHTLLKLVLSATGRA